MKYILSLSKKIIIYEVKYIYIYSFLITLEELLKNGRVCGGQYWQKVIPSRCDDGWKLNPNYGFIQFTRFLMESK